MASNTQLNASSSDGVIATSRELSHDGDTTQLQMVGLFSILGTESTGYTAVEIEATSSKGVFTDVTRSGDVPITLDGETVVLGAGTAAFGKLSSNTGVDIGDVDVRTVVTGTASSQLGKAEDAAHTSGDVGVMALGVQSSSDAPIAGTGNDYAPFQLDETGYVKVNVKASTAITVTPSSTMDVLLAANDGVDIGDVDVTSVLPGSGAANLGKKEDAAFASSDTGVMMLGVQDDVLAGTNASDGDYVPPRLNSMGAVYTQDAPFATGGLTVFLSSDADETVDQASTQACTLYHVSAQSVDATPLYLHLYDVVSSTGVSVGTTTPDVTYIVPSQGNGNGAGLIEDIAKGYAFANGICLSATTTIGGSGGPGGNECVVTLGLKK